MFYIIIIYSHISVLQTARKQAAVYKNPNPL